MNDADPGSLRAEEDTILREEEDSLKSAIHHKSRLGIEGLGGVGSVDILEGGQKSRLGFSRNSPRNTSRNTSSKEHLKEHVLQKSRLGVVGGGIDAEEGDVHTLRTRLGRSLVLFFSCIWFF